MSSLLLREIVPTENKLKTDCKNDKWGEEIYKCAGGLQTSKYNYKSNNHLEYSEEGVRPSLKWCGGILCKARQLC